MVIRSTMHALVAVGAATLVACSGSDASVSSNASSASVMPDDNVSEGEVFSDSASESAAPNEEPVVVSFDPVVETGVPGIDSDDAFCRSWSAYAGSVQALSLAWLVQTPQQAAALELAASGALVAAVDQMGANLPAEIEGNRQALTVDVPGPVLRRAERSRQLLIDAGIDEATITDLGDAWIAAITEAGLDAEDVALAPSGADEALADAADAFIATLPSFIEDPSLDTTQFDIGPSLSYISDNCPDQGTLAGDDNID